MDEKYVVHAAHCDFQADREHVYQVLKQITEPLTSSWERLKKAKTIAVKFNQDKRPEYIVMYKGNRQQLVSDPVIYATLRLLREHTDAKIYCIDVSFYTAYNGSSLDKTTQINHLLDEFDVEYMNGNEPPFTTVESKGPSPLFKSYTVMESAATADEIVSVAKMKNHNFMGVTGCLKNLFGLSPVEPHGRPRPYYHHLVRMPYMLTDIARIYDPALNIVDGLIAQAGMEWGRGVGAARETNTLIAGDHPVATDACMSRIMGHDPEQDWKTDPFLRDRNALLVSAQSGYGSVASEDIDFTNDAHPIATNSFFNESTDPPEMIVSWRESMCRQALWYRDHFGELEQYAHQYVLIQRNKVVWNNPDGLLNVSRRKLAGKWIDQSMFLKYVDPDERENERYEIYDHALANL